MPCRQFWQLDYAEHAAPDGEWNIVLPGPSLESTIQRIERRRPSIAVEGALRAPLPFGFWCCWGPPRPAHAATWTTRGCSGPMHDDARVLVTGCDARLWHNWLAERIGGDPMIAASDPKDPLPEPWVDERLERGPSWLLALRFAVLRGAARRVFVYGLDLAGEGYAWGWPDPARRDPSDWAGRWAGEQQLLERTMRVLERTGVELERAGCA